MCHYHRGHTINHQACPPLHLSTPSLLTATEDHHTAGVLWDPRPYRREERNFLDWPQRKANPPLLFYGILDLAGGRKMTLWSDCNERLTRCYGLIGPSTVQWGWKQHLLVSHPLRIVHPFGCMGSSTMWEGGTSLTAAVIVVMLEAFLWPGNYSHERMPVPYSSLPTVPFLPFLRLWCCILGGL